MPRIDTLKNTSIGQISETFNSAFADYSVPIVFNEEKLAHKLKSEGGRLDLSVGVFDDDALVAFILHYLDVRNGITYLYNGGTGVIPSHRGKQLTTQMYDFIRPILKEAQVDRMILEVFTSNQSASKIYQHQGFEIQREVSCYSGLLKRRNITLNNQFELVEIDQPNWELLSSFWDFSPTWQNSISTLNNMMNELLILAVKTNDDLVGYVVFNRKQKRIHQLAVRMEYRNKGIASALLNRILELESDKISILNVDVRTRGMNDFLEKRGFESFVNQFEMEMPLN